MYVGDVNVLEVFLGGRGSGKSTLMCYRTLALQRQMGAYVIGHSLGGRLPSRLPPELGGDRLPVRYHETIRSINSGLRWHPSDWHILAAPPGTQGASADDLLMYTQEVSQRIRQQAWSRTHWGQWRHNRDHSDTDATPLVVPIDEGIAVAGASHNRRTSNEWFLQYITSLRHMHVALLWSLQDPTAKSWRILEQATDITVFFIRHQWALMAVQAAGATPEEIKSISELTIASHGYVELELSTPVGGRRTAVDIQREYNRLIKERGGD